MGGEAQAATEVALPHAERVDALLARAADATEAVVGLGVGPAMNEYNGKPAV